MLFWVPLNNLISWQVNIKYLPSSTVFLFFFSPSIVYFYLHIYLLWLPQPDLLTSISKISSSSCSCFIFLFYFSTSSYPFLYSSAAFHICNWDQRLITFCTHPPRIARLKITAEMSGGSWHDRNCTFSFRMWRGHPRWWRFLHINCCCFLQGVNWAHRTFFFLGGGIYKYSSAVE